MPVASRGPSGEPAPGRGERAQGESSGLLLDEYGGSKKGAARNSLLGAGAGAVVTVPVPAAGLMNAVPPMILFGGAGTALIAPFTVRSLLKLREEGAQLVRVFERGLTHHIGGRVERVSSAGVSELTVFGHSIVLNGAVVGGVSGCYLQRPDGHKAILSSHHLTGVETLVPHIVASVTGGRWFRENVILFPNLPLFLTLTGHHTRR